MKVTQFFRKEGDGTELGFHVVSQESLSVDQAYTLEPFLQEFPGETILIQNPDQENVLMEVGTRPASVTPWSSNAVSILRDCGLPIVRIEQTRRLVLSETLTKLFDRMTECLYPEGDRNFLLSFLQTQPAAIFTVPVLEQGAEVLKMTSRKYGLAFDESLIGHLVRLFEELGRDPTIVELYQIGQMCSDHSRHITWNAKLVLDGNLMPWTLFDLAKVPYHARQYREGVNNIIAFHDNGSAICGFSVMALSVAMDGQYVKQKQLRHPVCSCETHNYPTSVSPFHGAITGIVGCYRDPQATGQGGVLLYSSAGFCTGFPRIPGYAIPGEEYVPNVYPANLASPLKIMLEAPAGTWAGGNQCGVPVLQGFTRAVELMVGAEGAQERYGYLKTLMYAGNTAYVLDEHTQKGQAEKGMVVIQFGGEAFPVGLGGAAGSSQVLGTQDAGLDFNAVQRGNPQMARRVANVIRRCVELGKLNPIVSIHDQGAGGPCNVLTELIEKTGGVIRLYKINLGDPTMSAIQIWCAEYQERQGVLIQKVDVARFQAICEEEDCPCEILGQVTDDGRIVVFASVEDELKNNACVDLPIERVVSGLPETIISDAATPKLGSPLVLPETLKVKCVLKRIFRQVDVGSKAYLVHRVDRSVGGLVVQQQCVGSLQLPVADVAVSALTHFNLQGMASAIGEQPMMMMLNPEAGARMALTEAITNLMWARVTRWEDISFPANWMWPARFPGEMCKLYQAAKALCDFSLALGLAQDGGKDSSSMAVRMGDELIKAPETLVIKAYATMKDVTKVLTPDIKWPGKSSLIHIDLAKGKRRLGGSTLAQVFGQLGDECPDLDDPQLLIETFNLIMRLIDADEILAGHDTTADGLAVTALEMAFAGNCGLNLYLYGKEGLWAELFAKEPGAIIEVRNDFLFEAQAALQECGIPAYLLGETCLEKEIRIFHQNQIVLQADTDELRQMWEETSYQLERQQINPICADLERKNTAIGKPPSYQLTFTPEPTARHIMTSRQKPRVAILREVGTNGEREMAAAFISAGFDAWDVPMKALLSGKYSLVNFSGLVFPGGFSFMDVFGAGKGWALKIRNNVELQQMFQSFRQDPTKWSLGVCNGDQTMKWLRWLYPELMSEHPLSIRNISNAFESRWVNVLIPENTKAMMFQGMEGSRLGVNVAHGEGRFWSFDGDVSHFLQQGLVAMQYINPDGQPVGEEGYPWNPSGSPLGVASLCSQDGQHLAMMPHPERSFKRWQWPWMPTDWKDLKASPWLRMFQNARQFCEQSR